MALPPADALAQRPALSAASADARAAARAVLRWRARWLGRHLPPRQAEAARLLPLLLHASFPLRGLSGDAPGLPGMRFRPAWSSLARAAGLPAPNRMQRGRPMVEAALGVATPGGLEVIVIPRGDAGRAEQGAVLERLEVAQAVLAAGGVPVRARLAPVERLAQEPGTCHRLLAFGGLLGGALDARTWQVVESASRPALEPQDAAALASASPSPLTALALTLLVPHAGPGPLTAILALLAGGEPARRLADPDHLTARWAALVPDLAPVVEELGRLVGRSGHADPADLPALVAAARTLAGACAGSVRACRAPLDRFARRLWREAIGPGVPRVLLPALGDRLRALHDRRPLRLDPARTGRCYEVRLPDGTVLGRGAGPVQARIRALGLVAEALAAAGGEGAVADATGHLDPAWQALALRLARRRERPARVLVVEAGPGVRPGPPHDVLNRGRERSMEFEGAVAVAVGPGRRPSGRMLSPPEVIDTVLREADGEAPIEVLGARPEARPLAARLAQISALIRDRAAAGPVAVEAGGRVHLRGPAGLRSYPLERFGTRPRRFTRDPEAPDLAGGPGSRSGQALRAAGLVHCRAEADGVESAAVAYLDEAGGWMRERVALRELDEHLREARATVRDAQPPAVLTVGVPADLEARLVRAGPPRRAAPVAVRGALPAVRVEVGGERFGDRGGLGWDAAAEALLAGLAPGAAFRVAVASVSVTVAGEPAGPLLSLWAASVARRRLQARLRRLDGAYRGSVAGRRTG